MQAPRQEIWLVTGASGLLGRHLVPAVAASGPRVLALARTPDGLEGAQVLVRELTDPAAFEDLEVDVVLHAAALSRVGACEREPELARRINVELPARLGSELRSARIVHVSTDLVFGHQEVPQEGFDETVEPQPASVYGETKLAGERALLAVRPDALVVRLPLLFGDSFGRGLGGSEALTAAVERGERPALFTDETRTPLDLAIAARALVRLARIEASGLLHLAGPKRVTRLDFGLEFVDRAAVEATTRRAAGLEGRPADTSLDGRRALELLGLSSLTELDSA